MWWLLYIGFSLILGYLSLRIFLPELTNLKEYGISKWLVAGPASFVIGTLILTSVVYAISYAMSWMENPFYWGNLFVFILMLGGIAYQLYMKKQKSNKSLTQLLSGYNIFFSTVQKMNWRTLLRNSDLWLAGGLLIFASFLMMMTLSLKGETVLLGHSVIGDMNAHIAMTRSFSEGQNIPTGYPFYASEQIRYHFMFYFLTGNLEYLGLPLDWAINLPSVFSFLSFLLLLYALAVVLTGYKAVGFITLILFTFRSSFAFIDFIISRLPDSLGGILRAIVLNDRYIGNTPHESFGMWTLNVYVNQRHFSFVLALLLISLLALAIMANGGRKRSVNNPLWF